MSTPPGALTPFTLSGEVLTPSAVIDPLVMPTHDFCNVVRDVLERGGNFHSEADLHAALDKVDKFEHALTKGDAVRYAVTENDRAGREDVTQRVAPQTGYAVPTNVPQIDYGMLARAIIQAQAEAQAAAAVETPKD